MATRRGASGLSLVVAVNKPAGLSSHDVVNRCRRIFGERRCGHTGTLDPLATGVLPICVGPATRLDKFMTSHDKRYRVKMRFGFETTTDDSAGERTASASIPSYLYDEEFARQRVAGLVGRHMQVPPRYSAIKIAGKKAYEAARAGDDVELEPRPIEVLEAEFVRLEGETGADQLQWVFDVFVSKGTYIRSLVRDLGRQLMCPAHVSGLERRSAGRLTLEHCNTLESIERLGVDAAIDPVRILGLRFAFCDDSARFVASGNKLYSNQVHLNERLDMDRGLQGCACVSGVCESPEEPFDGELACIVVENRLKGLYRFDARDGVWKAETVFSTGIYRG